MNRKLAIIVVSMLIWGLTSATVYAKDQKMSSCPMCGKHKGMCANYESKGNDMDLKDKFFKKVHFIFAYADDIELSDEQEDKIIEQKMSLKKEMIRNKADIKILMVDLKKELRKDSLDKNAINQIIDKKYDLKKQKAKDIVSAYIAVKDVLSEDQHAELKTLWKEQRKNKLKAMEECDQDESDKKMGMGYKKRRDK